MLLTWMLGGVVVVTLSLLHYHTSYDWEEHIFKYCFPILNFSFLIIAFISYGFVFCKYKQVHTVPPPRNRTVKYSAKTISVITLAAPPRENRGGRMGVFQLIRSSRFFAIFLLIVTFVFFIVVPDLVYLFVSVLNKNSSHALDIACWISYAIGNLADCYIYIFMQPSVRKFFLNKMVWRGRHVV